MSILSFFGKKDKRSTKIDPHGGTTGKMVAVRCGHSGLLAEDWLDLQALAGGKFLLPSIRPTPTAYNLRNWAVEVRDMLGWQVVERLTARELVVLVGPRSNFVKLTETGAAQMAEAMYHAQRLGLTREVAPPSPARPAIPHG